MMKVTVFVFRHSESFDNSQDLFSGWSDPDLTLTGLSQAKEIAQQLKSYRIDYAFTSHLQRAKKTLQIVLKEHPPIPVFIDDRLIERCYGLLQGKNKSETEKKNPEWYAKIHRGYDFPPPEGESIRMVEKRINSFFNQLTIWLEKNSGNVAISCHGNSIRPIMRFFEHLSIEQMLKLEAPHNTALIYELNFASNIKHFEEKATKPYWNGIVIPQKVKLATDPLNPLRVYYN
jgi:2,3-bisphosphoglycerate-dependent phosphoglycerate mutase